MKSLLLSALTILALVSTGCALQSGGAQSFCGNAPQAECMALSGDCGCGGPRGFDPPENTLIRRLGDNRGMGLRLTDRGSACQQRGNGLFARLTDGQNGGCGCSDGGCSSGGCSSGGGCGCSDGSCKLRDRRAARVADRKSGRGCGCGASGAAGSVSTGDCGCGGEEIVSVSMGDCGCGDEIVSVETLPSVGASIGSNIEPVVFQDGFPAARGVGRIGSRCPFGNCKFAHGLRGHGTAIGGQAIGLGGHGIGLGHGVGGCGVPGCGVGNRFCSSCLENLTKLATSNQHPYGGQIPHTAQGPGAGTGIAPSYAYPYYTTRGPRDFLQKKPPSIGY